MFPPPFAQEARPEDKGRASTLAQSRQGMAPDQATKPRPNLILDLVVPRAPWFWTVCCTLQRLEIEDLSWIAFPLHAPAAPATSPSNAGGASHQLRPQTPPRSAWTGEWRRIVEIGLSSHSNSNPPIA
ncbi:hypothetical protein KC19_VG071100 [Ceratodon purpureus]|uniref:Uncharacterized protein n=1 Tax=Ceratodon purpureus TaxID=3225 RepID=A0A8T0HMU0_CERPU|nr:hypothetical protein KC19_VG071100 [Ceratodon purpureus]